MYPEFIPLLYTHINYAFALVDPITFHVVPATLKDVDLMRRVTALKRRDPFLKVNIAIGGWAFNDPGSTATTFSDLAGSEANQRIFFKSLISFMATYDFDGVDIDWEYPVDKDRGGRPQDFKKFPDFMANLKNALKSTGGRGEVSVTLPASYWYLQHFDLKNLSPHVDYFNIMSYDLHGTWDKGNKWTGNILNAHTNLTEIELALDLIWRNDIEPNKVVMGLGFYARAFTVQDKNCFKQTGVLLNNEIDDIIKTKNLEPKLDKDAAVKILTWDDQWLTFDDEETLSLKTSHARLRCLGGVMVWAISHDTTDNKYAKALAKAAKRSFDVFFPIKDANDEVYIDVRDPVKQCKWTGCGQTCPNGYHVVDRVDKEAKKGEIMLDQTGCPKGSINTWCCPDDSGLVECGWYQHNNGKCSSECPIDHIEVGSNSMYCNNNKYQAACCKVEKRSMGAYRNVEWSRYPDCDSGHCPFVNQYNNQVLVRSETGSGGATCKPKYSGNRLNPISGWESRALCYGTKRTNDTLEDCFGNDFSGGIGNPHYDSALCLLGCPEDKIRLAMDTHSNECAFTGGANSFCCRPSVYTERTQTNPRITDFREALNRYLDKQQCPAERPFDLSFLPISGVSHGSIAKRDESLPKDLEILITTLGDLFQALTYTALQRKQVEDWDTGVRSTYPNLVMKSLKTFIVGTAIWKAKGAVHAVYNLLCDLKGFNKELDDKDKECKCHGTICQYVAEVCSPEDDKNHPPTGRTQGSALTMERGVSVVEHRASSQLHKRGELREYTAYCKDGDTHSLQISQAPYTSAGGWDANHDIWNRAIDVADRGDCGNPEVLEYVETPETAYQYHTEHLLEIQTITIFFEYASQGKYLYGTGTYDRIPCEFFQQLGTFLIDERTPPSFPGGYQSPSPNDRIMDALGSTANNQDFWLLQAGINGMKAILWSNKNPASETRMQALYDLDDPHPAIVVIQTTIAVFKYLSHPAVLRSLNRIENNLRLVFEDIVLAYNEKYGVQVSLVAAWDDFIENLLDGMEKKAKDFVENWIKKMLDKWDSADAPDQCAKAGAVADLQKLATYKSHIMVSTEGFGGRQED
ncbi:symbiotic chitinase [Arthroderma uncinatum]|uniref:symbiotic chitinase n=1 Tax=Arthroderma uncinatum TaxID=74035 RepID=UPI00144AE8FB|nr:symbiotic chitinase [Arthroderma uncinatum]KAF3481753.1 symbiotic chitinase [Arthroderma uncinatum]